MGAVGVRVADALEDGEVAGVVESAQAGESGIEGDVIGDFEGLVAADADARADEVVGVVGVGDDGIQTVVAAGQLENHEDGAVLAAGGLEEGVGG